LNAKQQRRALKAELLLVAARRLLLAALKGGIGLVIGLVILEATLRANPGLLFRGMAVPAPVDLPLTVREYDVRYSDADEIFWRPDLVQPVLPEDDRLEAHVRFETDEFGFRNKPPLPPTVDVVVLGLSISLGAQNARPWPDLLADQTGLRVLNLAQPGSGIEVKGDYMQRYGLPRRPRWVVVEVQPGIDIIGRGVPPQLLIEGLPAPTIQNLVWPLFHRASVSRANAPIYPLAVDIPGRTVRLTCCIHYLDTLTVDYGTTIASAKWNSYSRQLLDLLNMAQSHSVRVALLYAPVKPEIYFPLATNPAQLEPVLGDLAPLRLDGAGNLVPDVNARADINTLRKNALVGRDVIAAFARQHQLTFIDPTDRMVQAILHGQDPFMVYDAHWNVTGHQIVAQTVAEALQGKGRP
jgi:hypothetical protein